MATFVITGANQGIGHELVRQCARAGESVVAVAQPGVRPENLRRLVRDHPSVEIHEVELTDPAAIATLGRRLEGRSVDVLANVAATNGTEASMRAAFGELDTFRWSEMYAVNAIAPMLMIQALRPGLLAGGRRAVVNVSSTISTVDVASGARGYGYRASKAALNLLTRQAAVDLQPDGIAVVLLCPGWVRTEGQGGPLAPLGVAESVDGLRRVIDGIDLGWSGGFKDYRGEWVVPYVPLPGLVAES